MVEGLGPLMKEYHCTGGEASAGRKAEMIWWLTKPLKNGMLQAGIEFLLLLAFVALTSSILFIGTGSISGS